MLQPLPTGLLAWRGLPQEGYGNRSLTLCTVDPGLSGKPADEGRVRRRASASTGNVEVRVERILAEESSGEPCWACCFP